MADLDQALKLIPDDLDALVARADLHVSVHEKPAAIADLAGRQRGRPKEADVRLHWATSTCTTISSPQAIAQYTIWIDAHSGDVRMARARDARCRARALGSEELDAALTDCNAAAEARRQHGGPPRQPRAGTAAPRRVRQGHRRLDAGPRACEPAALDALLAAAWPIAQGEHGRGPGRHRRRHRAASRNIAATGGESSIAHCPATRGDVRSRSRSPATSAARFCKIMRRVILQARTRLRRDPAHAGSRE